MHLGGPGLAQHLGELLLGGAPHDRVVDDDDALARHVLSERVELHPHGPRPELLAGSDEAAADVAVLHHALAVGDPAPPGEALRGGHARLRYAHHHVRLDGGLVGQLLADVHPGLMDALVVKPRVGSGEVHVLEEAQPWVDAIVGKRPQGSRPRGVDDHHLAGVELPHEVGADDVQRGALRGEHPTLVELAEAQGAEPVGIAHTDDPALVHHDEGEGPLEAR